MDKEKIARIARIVESSAIAYIGIFFICMGITYFEEKLVYRLPRILLPVLDLFGHTGLAIGIILLGGGLIYYGFTKWKKVNSKQGIFVIIAVIGLAIGIAVTFISERKTKTSTEEMMRESDINRQRLIEEVKDTEKPDFKNPELDKHFNRFESMYHSYKDNLKINDETALAESEQAFMQWCIDLALLMEGLSNEEKAELARYNAKLSIMWSEARKNE